MIERIGIDVEDIDLYYNLDDNKTFIRNEIRGFC